MTATHTPAPGIAIARGKTSRGDDAMHSSLYDCMVMHNRVAPIANRFRYSIFMFHLDLDELDTLNRTLRLFGYNRRALFSMDDRDHINLGGSSVKENILAWIRSRHFTGAIEQITLLTNVRVFGYVFNPVSFYFCYGPGGEHACIVAEVGNTFGEQKGYLITPGDVRSGRYRSMQQKYFYVSPFINLESWFDFSVSFPGDMLDIRIDDHDSGRKFLMTTLRGKRVPLSDSRLAWHAVRFPLVTVKIIALIHYQALRLFLKQLPFLRKTDNPALQQDIIPIVRKKNIHE